MLSTGALCFLDMFYVLLFLLYLGIFYKLYTYIIATVTIITNYFIIQFTKDVNTNFTQVLKDQCLQKHTRSILIPHEFFQLLC